MSMSTKFRDLSEWFDHIDKHFKQYKPQYYELPDDPRIFRTYVSIQPNIYLQVYGACGSFEDIIVYKDDNIEQDIMTIKGLESYIDYEKAIYKFDINKDDNYNKLIENDGINGIMEQIKEAIDASMSTSYVLK